ncbi:biotin transporter BioY [Treponema paraluiscuniculi]|uniref:biotin transporter BioY n=1 Tax=Treponema paraluiscuniculi TaxID=53435 RepID=UPI0002ECEFE1|nr:biotin transporter BioY [Treponema paraluiscuniculi]
MHRTEPTINCVHDGTRSLHLSIDTTRALPAHSGNEPTRTHLAAVRVSLLKTIPVAPPKILKDSSFRVTPRIGPSEEYCTMHRSKSLAFVALFAALISSSALVSIPLKPVPLVLQNAAAVLTGLLLGPRDGALAVLSFLGAGLLGLPVFSGGRGGYTALFAPTGGFLLGYILAATLAGAIAQHHRLSCTPPRGGGRALLLWIRLTVATLVGFLSIYSIGLPVLGYVLGLRTGELMLGVFLPFFLADTLKIALVVLLAHHLAPTVRRHLYRHG